MSFHASRAVFCSINYHHNHQYQVFKKGLLLTQHLSLNLNCSSTALRSVRMMKYSPTAFSIIAQTWPLNANHYVNFLARFLGLVTRMPISSLQAHVHSALIVDWHSLQRCSQNLVLTLQSTQQNLNESRQPTAKHLLQPEFRGIQLTLGCQGQAAKLLCCFLCLDKCFISLPQSKKHTMVFAYFLILNLPKRICV